MIVKIIALSLGAYFVGAIPTGYWFVKYFFGIDVTQNGSKNIGATNVARVLGSKKYFLLIFGFDFLKAFLYLYFSNYFLIIEKSFPCILLLFAGLLLLGNGYSCFLRFSGGKGVATMAGILAYLFPMLFFVFLFAWGSALVFTKRVGYASLIALSAVFIVALLCGKTFDLMDISFLGFAILWIFYRHVGKLKIGKSRK